jgi:glyoxylase-like metal-dependent hydrolase (beta-lactamase superfamily II)
MSEHWSEENKNASPFVAAENGSVEERLRQLGLTPADVGTVVMSHLHTDHSGGLHLFKNAEVYVSDDEFTQVAKLWALGVAKPAYDRWDMGAYFGAGLNWRLVEREEQELSIAPGVTVLNFGSGHTYGLLGLLVELENPGNVLLVADAIHTKANAGPPVRSPGMVYDTLGYAATVKRIMRYAGERDARIIYGHDPEQFRELRLAPEEYYD